MKFHVVDVRVAQSNDVDDVVRIEALSLKVDFLGREKLEASIENGDVLVAESNREVVGFCVIRFREGKRSASLESIALLPEATGKGLGRVLLNAAEEVIDRRGYKSIRLEVRADNCQAMRFYRQSGFRRHRRVGRKTKYYSDGMAVVHMRKRMSKNKLRLIVALKRTIFGLVRIFQRP